MEPTLTAFVSKDSNETKNYKSGDKVKCDYGEGKVVTGELRNGWSIYSDGIKYADLYKERLQSKNITITPDEPTQIANSMEPTLTAFVSRNNDEQKTYKSGDKVKCNYGYGPEVIGELRNGWSIYNSNGSNIADIDNKSVLSKELTITPDTSPTISNPQSTGFSPYGSYYGGKRSRRKSRKSRKSRKLRR